MKISYHLRRENDSVFTVWTIFPVGNCILEK
jgi:hypothetical protein